MSFATRAPSSVADITSSLQVGAQRALHVERQRQPEIAVERTLVEFVEEHGGDAGQFRIVEDHAGEHAFGDDQNPGARRGAVFHAHGVADGFAGLLAEQRSHAARGGAGGKPARFEQHDPARAEPGRVEQRQRHQRGLAGAGRRDQHGAVAGLQRASEIGQDFA